MKIGHLSGLVLKLMNGAYQTPLKSLLTQTVRRQIQIDQVLDELPPASADQTDFAKFNGQQNLSPASPLTADCTSPETAAQAETNIGLATLEKDDFRLTIGKIHQAYRQDLTDPVQLIDSILTKCESLSSLHNPIHALDAVNARQSAESSRERLQNGTARILEGIPVLVKEELAVAGLHCHQGARWPGRNAASQDAEIVSRLRAAGAIIIGTTVMTQFGLSPLGVNPDRQMPLNPHDENRLAGGSSTGSAVAVAMGLVPLAIGLDGGGSIRIPAALCGVFGLKPTFGRLPLSGHGFDTGSTMIHVGPIGSSTSDLIRFMAAVDAPFQTHYFAASKLPIKGKVIGIDEAEWDDCERSMAVSAMDSLKELERDGAILKSVKLPYRQQITTLGYMTIGLEIASALENLPLAVQAQLEPYVRLFLNQYRDFHAFDYLQAQRLRQSLRHATDQLMKSVDVLALPTTQCVAPVVNRQEMATSFVDIDLIERVIRYSFFANLMGLPAATLPVGINFEGLPVGLQIIGSPWAEQQVLQVLSAIEQCGGAMYIQPKTHYGQHW